MSDEKQIEHTAGPYTVEEVCDNDFRINSEDHGGVLHIICHDVFDNEGANEAARQEAKATADFVALCMNTQPDLLKVAKMVYRFQRLLKTGNDQGNSDDFTIADLIEAATRAIAKAEPKP